MGADWIEQLALKLVPHLPFPAPTAGAVEDVVQLSDAWITALGQPGKLAAAIQDPADPVHVDQIRTAIMHRFDPEFDSRAKRLLSIAKETQELQAWVDRVEDLRDLIREFHSASDDQWQPMDLSHPERSQRAFLLPMALRRKFDDDVARLRRVGSTLPESIRPTKELAPTEKAVWDLLARKTLSAKEIGRRLKDKLSGSAVSKTVGRIRATGREIRHLPARGYYRPDAPPSDAPGRAR